MLLHNTCLFDAFPQAWPRTGACRIVPCRTWLAVCNVRRSGCSWCISAFALIMGGLWEGSGTAGRGHASAFVATDHLILSVHERVRLCNMRMPLLLPALRRRRCLGEPPQLGNSRVPGAQEQNCTTRQGAVSKGATAAACCFKPQWGTFHATCSQWSNPRWQSVLITIMPLSCSVMRRRVIAPMTLHRRPKWALPVALGLHWRLHCRAALAERRCTGELLALRVRRCA